MSNKTKFFTAVWVVIAVTLCAGSSLNRQRKDLTFEGFRLTAQLAKELKGRAVLGKPIVLTVTVKNVTNRNLPLFRTSFLYDYIVRVRDDRGKEVRLTEAGARRINNAGAFISREQFILKSKGEIEEKIDVSGIYDITTPGRYYISFERLVPTPSGQGWAKTASNVVEISLASDDK